MNIQLQEVQLQKLHSSALSQKNIQLSVLRLDNIHPQISGNKYFKLKYNILEAKSQGYDTILTFGGAFSNHIYATAQAAKLAGLKSIGIIRGEAVYPLNTTLSFATDCGMQLQFISRAQYKTKHQAHFKAQLRAQLGKFYLIPEGGSNALALAGIREILQLINTDFDYLATSCGTGATMAGLMLGMQSTQQKVLGFSALKGGDFLWNDIKLLLEAYFELFPSEKPPSVDEMMAKYGKLMLDYHFGGYAKKTPELLHFIEALEVKHQVPLEWIYTGKLFYGLFDLIQKDYFPAGTHIIALHTGGLRAVS